MDCLTHHLLRLGTTRTPDKEAVVDGGRRISYLDLDRHTSLLARALIRAGLERSDRVGIFMEKTTEEVLSILGVSKAGGVFVPLNHLLFPAQVRHIVDDCRPRSLITTPSRLATLRQVLAGGSSVRFVVTTEPVDERIDGVEILDMPAIFAAGSAEPPAERCISKDLAAILYTSGSTGKPKGVMLSHENLLAGSRIVSTYLGITERERILSILPFSFDYGLNQLLTALEHGATLILLRFRFPDEVVQAIRNERATGLAGVPPFWSVFSAPSSTVHKTPLPSLRYITNSGGAMPKALTDALRRALPATDIVLMYGLTEAFRSTYLPPDQLERKPGSMGKAIPDTEIYVLDENDRPCEPGQVGELVHRGPTVSLGYWGNQEATDKVLRPHPLLPPELRGTERVCYSGDLVRMDEEGYLFFVGRRDATIKCSGYRISPTEIEEVLIATGRIREAAAIGIPDELMGQAVMAVVVPHDGETLDVEAVLAHCAKQMPRYMVPRRVEIASSLPKTAHGKIDYPTLRSRALASPS